MLATVSYSDSHVTLHKGLKRLFDHRTPCGGEGLVTCATKLRSLVLTLEYERVTNHLDGRDETEVSS